MRRRLLKSFKQRIERRRRQHVNLVDDVNLVGTLHGSKVNGVDNLRAHVVDTRTTCSIELIDVRVGTFGNQLALRAGSIGHAA